MCPENVDKEKLDLVMKSGIVRVTILLNEKMCPDSVTVIAGINAYREITGKYKERGEKKI